MTSCGKVIQTGAKKGAKFIVGHLENAPQQLRDAAAKETAGQAFDWSIKTLQGQLNSAPSSSSGHKLATRLQHQVHPGSVQQIRQQARQLYGRDD